MSCHSENSCAGRSFLKWVVLLLIGAVVLSSYKEIFRYIKISTM